MVEMKEAGVKVGSFAFPAAWVRRYPPNIELCETDHLAVGSGAWDRYTENPDAFRREGGHWVEDLEGVTFDEVDVDYLDFLLGRSGRIADRIAEWRQTPEGREAFSHRVWPSRETGWMYRTWGSLMVHRGKRATEAGAGEGFLLAESKSGFIPGTDDTTDDGWYSGARWIQTDRPLADYDPSPWTVAGMVARSRGELKFKCANLLPVEGRGGPELDWTPAPWQAYRFLTYLGRSGERGWLSIRKSSRTISGRRDGLVDLGSCPVPEVGRTYDAGGDFPVRHGHRATTTPSFPVTWRAAVEALVRRTTKDPAGVVRKVVVDVAGPAAAAQGERSTTLKLFVPTWDNDPYHLAESGREPEYVLVTARREAAADPVEPAVRVGYEVAPVYEPRSEDGVVELPGYWLPDQPARRTVAYKDVFLHEVVRKTTTVCDPATQLAFVDRHRWDAVLAAATTLRSLYQAISERGLGAISGEPHAGGMFEWQNDLAKSLGTGPVDDPRRTICLYTADVYSALPPRKDCAPDLQRVWDVVGRMADLIVTLAAKLADEAAKPRARDEYAAMSGRLGRFAFLMERGLRERAARRTPERDGDEAVSLHRQDLDARRAALRTRLKLKAFLEYERATKHRRKFQVTAYVGDGYAVCVGTPE